LRVDAHDIACSIIAHQTNMNEYPDVKDSSRISSRRLHCNAPNLHTPHDLRRFENAHQRSGLHRLKNPTLNQSGAIP
jgi:hypothetical protein